jgi:hypothetical protein
MTPDFTDGNWRTELAARDNHGISVRLYWSRETDVLTVTVSDSAYDDYFELVLDADEEPLDVFHHPYAHAAARGIDFRPYQPADELFADAA